MRRLSPLYLYLVVVVIMTSCTIGGSPKIRIEEARLVASHQESAASAFMLIINDGNGRDALIGCSIKELPSVECELHDVIKGKMQRVSKIDIPAQRITPLKRGGFHLMLFNLPDESGGEITFILKFEKSGDIEVKASSEHHEGAGHIHHQ